MKAAGENYIIQAVSRALDLLEQFQEGQAEFGISELSSRLHLQKNNVFRLVATLKAKNYIEINNLTGKYRLGIKTRALGQSATRQLDFAGHVRPFLDELKQQCHEACYFSIIKDRYSYYLEGVESDLPVRVTQRVGTSRPLYCTAAGRAQLVGMTQEKQIEMLSGIEISPLTAKTITNPAAVQNELNRVARQGYAIEDQEHDAGVMEIAAPVFDSQGATIGALSILGPEMRLAGPRLENELPELLCRSAFRLSISLGYRPMEKVPDEINLPARQKRKTVTSSHVTDSGATNQVSTGEYLHTVSPF
jgi:DNA-binding IclR family transcriptional regulator